MTDQLRYLGDYGVSCGVMSAQEGSNPIIHMANGRVIHPECPRSPSTSSKLPCEFLRLYAFQARDWPLFLGVGNNPDAFAAMGSAHGGRWYILPFRIVPEFGKGAEYGIHPSIKQRSDVLHDNVARSNLANEASVFIPEAAALTSKSCLKPCPTDILAGEPPADGINGNSIGSKAVCGKLADVMIAGNLWPMLGKDAAREFLDFTKSNGLETACALQAKAEAADAAEEVKQLVWLAAHARTPSVENEVRLKRAAVRLLASLLRAQIAQLRHLSLRKLPETRA